jgi:hypothetical protein
MKKILIGAAVVATLTLSGLSARAGCVDPRNASQQTTPFSFEPGAMPSRAGHEAGENIVGTWRSIAHMSFGTTSGGYLTME